MKQHKTRVKIYVLKYTILIIIAIIGIQLKERNIQHLLCAMVICEVFNDFSKVKLLKKCIIFENGYLHYILWCILWELYQYFTKLYFQIDQLVFDLLGVILAYLIFSKFRSLYKKNL